MLIKSIGKSDVGRRREKNEDAFLINESRHLYVIADGMGGHLGGEFASHMAINTIGDIINAVEDDPNITLMEGESLNPGDYAGSLRYAVKVASHCIFEKANQDVKLHGMGTTAVVLLVRNNKAYIANVGDSRAYRIRDNNIEQITRDHSLVEEQIRAGLISPNDSRVHRLKNIITRSVGFQDDVETDIDIRVLREGDVFLLCTDGLSNMINDEEIKGIVLNNKFEVAVNRLVDVANERGGEDNITVILTQIVTVDKEDKEFDRASNLADDETIEMG